MEIADRLRRLGQRSPPPLPQKLPIAPIFIAGSISLAVSREKDGKLRIVSAGWDNANVVQPDGYGQAHGGWEADLTPPSADPLLTPLVFHQLQVPLTCIEPCIFRPPVRPSVMRNGPLPLCVTGRLRSTNSSSGPAMKTCLIFSNEDRRCPICLR